MSSFRILLDLCKCFNSPVDATPDAEPASGLSAITSVMLENFGGGYPDSEALNADIVALPRSNKAD
jgi:hypothetical protein